LSRPSRSAIWRPTPQELLLLRAGLWQGEAGLAAWREWRRGAPDIDSLEPGSHRLLPLVYRNLGPLLADDPDARRLKSVYRRSWMVNQLGLKIGRRAIEALQAAGLETLVLKGGALIASAYRDAGARPMGDLDVAVRPDRVAEATQALRSAAFTPAEEDPERALAVRHSLAFKDENGQEVDLHRSMLWRPGLDEDFWRGSVELDVAGTQTRGLCPADQLLHVCVHGAAWNPVQPIRWAADSYKVLEAADDRFDWDRLVSMAVRGRLTLPIHDAVSYLARELEAPVPEEALQELAAAPVTAAERRAHEALAQPPSSRRSLAMLWWFWKRHRAEAALEDERPGPGGLLRHLRSFWGLDRTSQVPGYAIRRLLRPRS
jgi:hypothetical protein